MTLYTHLDLDGVFGPNDGFTLNDIRYTRAFWRTADAAKIASLGFVEYVAPEPTFAELKAAKITAINAKL